MRCIAVLQCCSFDDLSSDLSSERGLIYTMNELKNERCNREVILSDFSGSLFNDVS